MENIARHLSHNIEDLTSIRSQLSFSQQQLLDKAMQNLVSIVDRLDAPNLELWSRLPSNFFIHRGSSGVDPSDLWNTLSRFAPYVDYTGLYDIIDTSFGDDVNTHFHLVNTVGVLENASRYILAPEDVVQSFDFIKYISLVVKAYPSVSANESWALLRLAQENKVLSAHYHHQVEKSILEHFVYALGHFKTIIDMKKK